MKKIFTVMMMVTLFLYCFALESHAARRRTVSSEPAPKNSISIDPMAPLLSPVFPIEYEYTMDKNHTIAGRLGFGGWGGGGWSTSIFSLGGSYRFFNVIQGLKDNKVTPAGLWFGPALDLMVVSSSFTYTTLEWDPTIFNYRTVTVKDSGSSVFFSISGEAGYEWLFKDAFGKGIHLTVSPSLHLGYTIGSLDLGSSSLAMGGFGIALGTSVGVAF